MHAAHAAATISCLRVNWHGPLRLLTATEKLHVRDCSGPVDLVRVRARLPRAAGSLPAVLPAIALCSPRAVLFHIRLEGSIALLCRSSNLRVASPAPPAVLCAAHPGHIQPVCHSCNLRFRPSSNGFTSSCRQLLKLTQMDPHRAAGACGIGSDIVPSTLILQP